VDRGVVNLAVDSDGTVSSGAQVHTLRRRRSVAVLAGFPGQPVGRVIMPQDAALGALRVYCGYAAPVADPPRV
jgi:hypothetical protein